MNVFAIEPTNHCNAYCGFCPWPTATHDRPRGFMSLDTLARILALISSDTVAINGLGEPLIHKQCDEIVRRFTEQGVRTQLNSNGLLLNQKWYDRLLAAGLSRLIVTADYHPWGEKQIDTDPALPLELYCITREEEGHIHKELDDWAGQVGSSSRPDVPCSFIYDDWYQIQWNGDVLRCCADFNGTHKLGNIHGQWVPGGRKGRGIPLCAQCHGYHFTNALVMGDYTGEEGNATPEHLLQIE
ncbi:MAG: radical SAM protein [Candidatus Latescibacteria bacterium]|nr:radical SAM protein [Candidatus Latescibacterota bacterium]